MTRTLPTLRVTRRSVLRLLGAACLGTALTACGAPSPTATPATGAGTANPAPSPTMAPVATSANSTAPVHLIFMSDIGGPHVKLRQKWAEDFSKAHPGITVESQPVVDHYSDKLLTAFAGGSAPDIFRYLQEIIPIDAAVQRKLLLALDSYVQADNYDLTDFLPQALELYRWGGKLYSLPRDYGLQVVYYNVDLFKKAGLNLPPWQWDDKSWTYDRYLEAARALTVRSGNSTTQWGCLVNTGWRPWASFVYCNGGTVVKKNQNGEAIEITLTEEPAVDGLQFLQDLMYKYQVAPRPTVQQEMGGLQLFMNGKVGMVIDNPSAVQNYRQIKDFTWDVATLPIGNGVAKRGTGGGGTGWAAAAATKHPDQAWQFVSYIASRQAELDEVAIGGTTPSRKSVVTSSAFLNTKLPPASAKTFPDGQNYVVRDPVNINWPQISQQILTQQMSRLWNGSASAKEVTAAIKQQADPLLQKGLSS
jgi:multiple sugar transport system substrate-binding protein